MNGLNAGDTLKGGVGDSSGDPYRKPRCPPVRSPVPAHSWMLVALNRVQVPGLRLGLGIRRSARLPHRRGMASKEYPSEPMVGVGVVILRHLAGQEAEALLIRRGKPPSKGGGEGSGGALMPCSDLAPSIRALDPVPAACPV